MISTGIELELLGNVLSDVEQEASELQEAISFNETRGIKTTVKQYNKLLDNSKSQIKNLQKQNDLLQKQQSLLNKDSQKWRDIKQQIDSNNASIRSLMQSQYEWGQNIALGQIKTMMDAFDAAQDALGKGHLNDTDTLVNLIAANRNFADALMTTTTGTYVDAQALANLAREQGDLTVSMIDAQKAAELVNYKKNEKEILSLAKTIDPTIDTIEELNKAIANEPDSPDWAEILNLQQANKDIQTTIDNL